MPKTLVPKSTTSPYGWPIIDPVTQERTWRTNARPTQQGPDGFKHVPTVATRSILARVTGIFYFLGGAAVLSRVPDLSVTAPNRVLIVTIGVFAMAFGPIIVGFGKQFPRWAYHGLVGLVTTLITVIIVASDGTQSAETYALIYILVIIDAAFFFSWSGMLFHTLTVQIATALSLSHIGTRAGTIGVYLGIYLCISFTVAYLARVADRAEEDPLTSLTNRRGLARHLEICADVAARTGDALSVIIIDLDHFKSINDTLGHAAGDELLIACAKQWRQIVASMPGGDVRLLCRYGGDEFALLLPGYTLGRTAELADRMRTSLPGGRTASIGVATWEHGDSGSMLMSRADVALYDAKTNGRDQTVVYGDPGHAARELEAAIADKQLVMHYQPVVRLSDGETISHEALVRWAHPNHGLVSPGAFVGRAERTGSIHSLGAWALDEALKTAAAQPVAGNVSVNVSVAELRNPGYPALVADTLNRHQMSGPQLTVEVPEAVFDHHDDQVGQTLVDLRALGVKVALDDFGSGYSSLRWLSKYPLDALKIDGEFVSQITDDMTEAPILEAVIALGHALGVTIIAEHVETQHQAEMLKRLGCEFAQGFYFGRPAPAPDEVAEPRDPATLNA